MKIVQFKNGDKIKVADEVANVVSKNIITKDGVRNWQTFTEQSTGEFILMFNLNEVVAIYSNENIL